MIKVSKITLAVIVLFCTVQVALADKGIGRRTKSKVSLNISTPTTLRNSISLNLKTGLKYSGSLFVNKQVITNNTMMYNTLVTYQKGNSVYIIPYKQRIVIPEIKQGYAGMKLIIRPKH